MIDLPIAHEELRRARHRSKDQAAGLRTDLDLVVGQPFAPAAQAIQHALRWISIQCFAMLAR